MMLIPCPCCGPRDETEFLCGGETRQPRPDNPELLDNTAWSEYLYNSRNRKGWVREWWWHLYGCESWFEIERHTVSHQIRDVSEDVHS